MEYALSGVTVWKLQTAFSVDTLLPKDQLIITPHFDDGGILQDAQGLCDDLAAALNGWDNATRQIRVTAYDAQGTVPVLPQGEAIVNPNLSPATVGVREVALCLSFYAGENRPRQRGRLYIPAALGGIGTGTARPNSTQREKVGALATIFADLGGLDVDWSVYSRVDDDARPVTNWWVDDAWDIQRSRGLEPTTRLSGTVGEA
jgi:hypothetical protein